VSVFQVKSGLFPVGITYSFITEKALEILSGVTKLDRASSQRLQITMIRMLYPDYKSFGGT